MDGPLVITFGVEFEFYIQFHESDFDIADISDTDAAERLIHDDQRQKKAARRHMVNTLRENHLAVDDYDANYYDYTKWTVSTDSTIMPYQDNVESLPEGSLREEIELISPVLTYSSDTVDEVVRVLSIINTTFNTGVNRSTGFHVHVGSGTAGFPLQTAQNLASLVTVFQRQIHSIHPEERLINGDWCPPPGVNFRHQPPLEIAKTIQNTSSFEEFWKVVSPERDKHVAYNFENLSDDEKKTIEFRQHKGTMDCDEAANWIHLVCGLIRQKC
ncbi:MAG: hypothetical protein M1830_008008 [Pleopsidium flavum]|nr:MAG: hypothetical protein M1830_008008 [Pleopsidium flavum]